MTEKFSVSSSVDTSHTHPLPGESLAREIKELEATLDYKKSQLAAITAVDKPSLDKPFLDKLWNEAIEAAAFDCANEAYAHRTANSGGDGSEPGWNYAKILDRAAESIRKLKR